MNIRVASHRRLEQMGKVAVILAAGALLAGCCSPDSPVVQQSKEKAATAAAAASTAPVPTTQATGNPVDIEVVFDNGASVTASVLKASCDQGKGARAAVRIGWDASALGIKGVRALVVEGDKSKTWVESGAVWSEDTGAWMEGGMEIKLVALPGEDELARVRAVALACGGR